MRPARPWGAHARPARPRLQGARRISPWRAPTRRALALALLAAPLGACSQLSLVMPLDLGRGQEPTGAVAAASPAPAESPARVSSLSEADWSAARSALVPALARAQGMDVPWINPDTGVMGTVALADQGSGPCRPFGLTVFDKDRAGRLSGRACQGPDGQWDLSNLTPRAPGA